MQEKMVFNVAKRRGALKTGEVEKSREEVQKEW